MALTLKDSGYDLLLTTTSHYSNEELSEDLAKSEIIILDAETYGRLDILVMATYGDIAFLPLLLDYNMITDVENMNIGDKIVLPTLQTLLNINEDFDMYSKDLITDSYSDEEYIIPGFINNITSANKTISDKSDITVANKKLKIVQKSSTYNAETGVLIF